MQCSLLAYRHIVTGGDLLWKHPVQQHIRLLFLFCQLVCSLRYNLFQIVGILLHHTDHVVHYIDPPSMKTDV